MAGFLRLLRFFRFQIAQGELSDVKVTVPPEMTVTSVDGSGLGAWRFDPVSHSLEVKLAVPAHEEWALTVVTQSSGEGTPYDLTISILSVENAASQRGTTGIIASPSVHFAVRQRPQEMNVDDFVRDAAPLLGDARPEEVRCAFRTNAASDVLAVQVSEVRPELRSEENTTFSIADDRLVCNTELSVEIAKAGVFSVELSIPAGYDIDALAAPEVSHWDDAPTPYGRAVQVHFRARTLGRVGIRLAISRPESELPRDIAPHRGEVDPVQTTKTSVHGAINMLGLAKRLRVPILQASTSEVYGDPEVHPQTEDYWGRVNPIGVRSCYDEGKRCAETLFFDYHRQHGLEIKVVRIFNTYGPRMHPNDGRVVSNFIVQALKGQDITVYGTGSQTRSFQYVDDLVEGMIRLMATGDDVNFPVNIGNPGEFTILELAQKVIELTKSKSKIVYMPLPQDDPMQRKPDITLAHKVLNGWEPKVPLNEGLAKTIDYFKRKIS